MTSYLVGAGILKRMRQMGTEPASDELYTQNPSDGSLAWSEAMGMDARIYRFLPATGQVLHFDPLSWVPVGSGPDPSPAPVIKQVRTPNFWLTREGHSPIALVIHTMGGTLAGTASWFANPASQVSAHFGIGLSGAIHEYVPLDGSAWANGVLEPGNIWPGPAGVNPNLLTVSVETEDLGNAGQTVTEAQYASTLAACRLALAKYPSIRYVLRHGAISPRSRPICPGTRWTGSGAFAALARELGLEAR